MATVVTALVMLGFIALVVGIFLFVHKRDQKREARKINTL
jgi:uncharacterized membrane protein HdeD (DUF308 family)